jgi:hypothetical protein
MSDNPHELAVAHFGAQYLREPPGSWEAKKLIRGAQVLEQHNRRAQTQPPYSEEEQHVLSDWRAKVLEILHIRLAQHSLILNVPPISDQCPRGTTPNAMRSHRALAIPELLDNILSHAGPDVQLAAWSISRTWRRSALALIGSRQGDSFWHSCAEPVEYGDTLGTHHWVIPNEQETEMFSSIVLKDVARRPTRQGSKFLYFPALFTQQLDLPDDVCSALNDLDTVQNEKREFSAFCQLLRHARRSRKPDADIYWLDMSQFHFNPYFGALFGDRMQQRRGRFDIDLHSVYSASPGQLLVDRMRYPPSLLDCIGRMYLTQPPCKVLGVYHQAKENATQSTHRVPNVQLLERIHNAGGIRVSELLAALDRYAPVILSTWIQRVKDLAKKVETGHWQEDIWNVPGAPRISILLDNTDMGSDAFDDDVYLDRVRHDLCDLNHPYWGRPDIYPIHEMLDGHITRFHYVVADGWREERQGEWMPREMVEPMKSTIRAPIKWDT